MKKITFIAGILLLFSSTVFGQFINAPLGEGGSGETLIYGHNIINYDPAQFGTPDGAYSRLTLDLPVGKITIFGSCGVVNDMLDIELFTSDDGLMTEHCTGGTFFNIEAVNSWFGRVDLVYYSFGAYPDDHPGFQIIILIEALSSCVVDIISDSPVCEGNTLNMHVINSPEGAVYQWTGPDGFTGTGANVSIPNATVANGGTYQVVMTDNGVTCPPVLLEAKVNPSKTTQLYDTIYVNENYIKNGFTIPVQTSVGLVQDVLHLSSHTGCDSTVFLDLQVIAPPIIIDISSNAPVCEGDALNLYVNNPPADAVFQWTGPDGFTGTGASVSIPNSTAANAGTYKVVMTTGDGVISKPALLEAKVNPPQTTQLHDTIYVNENYIKNGFTIPVQTSVGLVQDVLHLSSHTGCDSTVFLDLQVIAPPIIIDISSNAPVCEGDALNLYVNNPPADAVFQWTGPDGFTGTGASVSIPNSTVVNVGTYKVVMTTGDGVISKPALLEAKVNPSKTTQLHDTIYVNENYIKNGFTIPVQTSVGLVQDVLHLSSHAGCDSTVFLDLQVIIAPVYSTVDATICENDTYLFKGNYLNAPGIYQATFTTVNGGDSIVTLHLKMNPVYNNTIKAFICKGDNYIFNGKNYSVTGVYTDILQSTQGCDSIRILDLTVVNQDKTILYDTIYIGNDYNKDGFYFPVQNAITTLEDTLFLQNQYGCDSLVILNLEVLCSSKKSFLNDAVCLNNSYNKYGFTLPAQTIAGVFNHQLNLFATNGCDSIVYLKLQVNAHKTTTINDTVYLNESYNKNGFVLPVQTVAGEYTHTLHLSTTKGCDSTVVLNLKVLDYEKGSFIPDTVIDDVICQNSLYSGNGFFLPVQSIPGEFTHQRTLNTPSGLNSTVILHLLVNPTYTTTLYDRVSAEEAYTDNGFYIPPHFSVPGLHTYEQHLITKNGCDSTVILNLAVDIEIYPGKFFTPNGDGINDYWVIENIEYFEYEYIEIYDRFSKLVKKYTNGNFTPWDGNYLRKELSSTDYWYNISMKDGKVYTGHFSLIR